MGEKVRGILKSRVIIFLSLVHKYNRSTGGVRVNKGARDISIKQQERHLDQYHDLEDAIIVSSLQRQIPLFEPMHMRSCMPHQPMSNTWRSRNLLPIHNEDQLSSAEAEGVGELDMEMEKGQEGW